MATLSSRDHRPAENTGDARTIGLLEDNVGSVLKRPHRIGDRDRELAGIEEGRIILGVADPDGVVRGDPELGEDLEEPGGLCHRREGA